MTKKVEIHEEVEEVDIEALWKAVSKDKIEFMHKTYPDLLIDAQILDEGDANGLGALLLYNFGPGKLKGALISAASSNIPPYMERIVELDESKHLVSFQGVEGGYLELGFTHFLFSIKLDETGSRKISIQGTVKYDFKEGFDGAELVKDFSSKIRNYIDNLVSYLKANK